jgi:hypothetical protein
VTPTVSTLLLIEAERCGFDEPPYVALQRLLKLPPLATANGSAETEDGADKARRGSRMASQSRTGRLRAWNTYGAQTYEGKFLNRRLVVNGRSFDTLSAAASALAVTKDGSKTNLNGWNYWKVKFPGDTRWRGLRDMRRSS